MGEGNNSEQKGGRGVGFEKRCWILILIGDSSRSLKALKRVREESKQGRLGWIIIPGFLYFSALRDSILWLQFCHGTWPE